MIRGITFDQQAIKAEDMAHFMRKFSANANGITRGCNITNDSSKMYISEGYMIFQGRQVEIIGTQEVSFETVTTGELYCVVVMEIDLSKSNTETACNQLALKTLTSSSGYPSLTQQDLEDNPTGKYQYELARYRVSTSGMDSFKSSASEVSELMPRSAFKLTGTDLYIDV